MTPMTPDERRSAVGDAHIEVTKAIFAAEEAEAKDQRLEAIRCWAKVAQIESTICDLTRAIIAWTIEYDVAAEGVAAAIARAQELETGYPMHRSISHAKKAYRDRRSALRHERLGRGLRRGFV